MQFMNLRKQAIQDYCAWEINILANSFCRVLQFFQPKNDDAVCVIPTCDLKHGKKHLKGIKP